MGKRFSAAFSWVDGKRYSSAPVGHQRYGSRMRQVSNVSLPSTHPPSFLSQHFILVLLTPPWSVCLFFAFVGLAPPRHLRTVTHEEAMEFAKKHNLAFLEVRICVVRIVCGGCELIPHVFVFVHTPGVFACVRVVSVCPVDISCVVCGYRRPCQRDNDDRRRLRMPPFAAVVTFACMRDVFLGTNMCTCACLRTPRSSE